MAKQKLTQRLAEVRVSQELFNKVHQVAMAQELDIADVQRLALEDYCSPPENAVRIPIAGEIKDNHVVFYPWVRIETKLSREDVARYLEVEPAGGRA
jgi:hypothetical protein